ncbi:MAG: hypothetical protein ACRD2L_20575, partial [Terriglobia bacterium]
MAGWNGAGIYDLRYNFVTDAAGGIKILASRQDDMWNDLKTGIQNCWTLDGQTLPTANFNMNAKKLTNIAAATAATDVPQFQQITSTEWVTETAASVWINATQFKLTAVDLTSRYHVGRRVKFLDNGVQ